MVESLHRKLMSLPIQLPVFLTKFNYRFYFRNIGYNYILTFFFAIQRKRKNTQELPNYGCKRVN